ncbi:MAG TPA: hypothetical protein VIL86_17640 [Tepidisphaeraceae bacterium]
MSGAEFQRASFIAARGRKDPSLIVSVRYPHRKRNPVENLSFNPFDALKMLEAAAVALRNGGCAGIERVARALLPTGTLEALPQKPIPMSSSTEADPAKTQPNQQTSDFTTLSLTPAVFLNTQAANLVAPPHTPFVLISLARRNDIEQFPLAHHDALLLVDSMIQVLIKNGSAEDRRVAKAMKEKLR